MELQVAFDVIDRKQALEIAGALDGTVDIIEMGTPFSFVHPISIVREFKEAAPNTRILSDFKIMDGGYGMAKMAYDAGADVTTVSARTWDDTIRQAIESARDHNKQTLVDMMGMPEALIAERGAEIDAMKPDYICIHRAVSVASSSSPERPLQLLRGSVKHAKIAVAGGINLETLPQVVASKPDLVIIGSAIANSQNPVAVAKEMRRIMEG